MVATALPANDIAGRTVLVRVEQRGPMTSNALIALSPAAMITHSLCRAASHPFRCTIRHDYR